MPKLKNQFPKMCQDGKQCYSWHNRKRYYHGKWDTPEAKKSYDRFIAALMENPTQPFQDRKTGDVLVSELAASFLTDIETRTDYTDLSHFKRVIGFLVEKYGGLPVNDFSPKKLKDVRSLMVKGKTLCRRMVNNYADRVIRIFSWGVGEELGTTDVGALREVPYLQKGESGTFDNAPRKPVPDDVVRNWKRAG